MYARGWLFSYINPHSDSGQRALFSVSPKVIGGTSGMGYAIVEKLAKGDAQVILTGRNRAKLQEAEKTYGDKVSGIRSDTDMSDINKLGSQIKEKFGSCEIETFDAITEDSYDRQLAVNTKGAFFTVQQLVPYMKEGVGSYSQVQLPIRWRCLVVDRRRVRHRRCLFST